MAASILSADELSSLESSLPYASELERQRIEEILRSLSRSSASESPPIPASTAQVAKTRGEAARLLGVDERTLSKWAADPTFPGKAGTAGQRNGHFPIGAIRAWRQQVSGNGDGRATDADPATQLRLRKLAAETARREVDLEIKLGTLIDRETAESTITSAIATARSLLEELPEQIAEGIPASRPKLRKMARRIARRKVLQVLEALADCEKESDDDSDDDTPRAADAGGRDPPASAPRRAAKAEWPHSRRVGGRAKAETRSVVPRKPKARSPGGK